MRSDARRSLFLALVGGVPRPPARRRQGAGLGAGPALAGSLAGVMHPAGGPPLVPLCGISLGPQQLQLQQLLLLPPPRIESGGVREGAQSAAMDKR